MALVIWVRVSIEVDAAIFCVFGQTIRLGTDGMSGKWAPEMTLRLAIGHRADVWGTAARDPDEEIAVVLFLRHTESGSVLTGIFV